MFPHRRVVSVGTIAVILSMIVISAMPSDAIVSEQGRSGASEVQDAIIMADEVKNPDTFIEANIGEPEYLDPAVDYESAGGEVLQSVYENLVWYDGSSPGNLKPVLAKEIPTLSNGLVSADRLNYTFNIRTGITFHDGTVLSAEDVVYSIQRVLQIHDPAGPGWMIEQILTDYLSLYIGSTIADWGTSAPWLLAAVGGTDPAYVLTEQDMVNVSQQAIVKVNSTAVVFRLTHPYPGFLKIAATTVMSIVSRGFVEAHGGIVSGEHNGYMDQHTCGTGPYELVEWNIGNWIHLARYDNYWGARPNIRDVYIVKANEATTRVQMLKQGDADSAYIPITYESEFAGDPNVTIVKGLPSFDLTFMALNFNIDAATANSLYGGTITSDFFADKHMRKAFTHLLNYSQYITATAMGNAIQPNGVIPMGMFGYDPAVPKYDYSLAAAAAEFQLAVNSGTGNSWWDDGFTIPLFYNVGSAPRQTVCEMIKVALEALSSPGGMTATINALDWPTYVNEMYNTNGCMPLYLVGWGADYADPDDYANPMLLSVGMFPRYTGYHNTTIDALIIDAAAEFDENKRADLYSDMSMLVHDDCPYIWLTQQNNFHIERSWIAGYYYNPMFEGLYFPALIKPDWSAAPDAFFTATPLLGDLSTTFMFDASGSSDSEDPTENLEVRWDWEGDGTWDVPWTTNKTASHMFSALGSFNVTLEVRDSDWLTDTKSLEVLVVEQIAEFRGIVVPVLALVVVVLIARGVLREEKRSLGRK